MDTPAALEDPAPSTLQAPWTPLTPAGSVQGRGFCSVNRQLPGPSSGPGFALRGPTGPTAALQRLGDKQGPPSAHLRTDPESLSESFPFCSAASERPVVVSVDPAPG